MPAPRPLLFELQRLGLDLSKKHTAKEIRAAAHAAKRNLAAEFPGPGEVTPVDSDVPVAVEEKPAKKTKDRKPEEVPVQVAEPVVEEPTLPVVVEEDHKAPVVDEPVDNDLKEFVEPAVVEPALVSEEPAVQDDEKKSDKGKQKKSSKK